MKPYAPSLIILPAYVPMNWMSSISLQKNRAKVIFGSPTHIYIVTYLVNSQFVKIKKMLQRKVIVLSYSSKRLKINVFLVGNISPFRKFISDVQLS